MQSRPKPQHPSYDFCKVRRCRSNDASLHKSVKGLLLRQISCRSHDYLNVVLCPTRTQVPGWKTNRNQANHGKPLEAFDKVQTNNGSPCPQPAFHEIQITRATQDNKAQKLSSGLWAALQKYCCTLVGMLVKVGPPQGEEIEESHPQWLLSRCMFTSEFGTSTRSARGSPAVWELAWACGLTGAPEQAMAEATEISKPLACTMRKPSVETTTPVGSTTLQATSAVYP